MLQDMKQKDYMPYESVQKLNDQEKINHLEAIYTFAGVDAHYDILDEKPQYDSSSTVSMLHTLDSKEMLGAVGQVFGGLFDKVALADNYEFLLNLIKDENMDTTTKIGTALQVLPAICKDVQFGNIQGFKAADFVKGIADLYSSADFSKIPADASISAIVPNLATSIYGIHGIKLVEGILGMLIYISADKDHLGTVDRTSDTFHDDILVILKTFLNSMTSKSTPSMADLLVFGMAAPVLSGGVYLQDGKTDVLDNIPKFIDEIFEEAKALGMNIDSVKPTKDLEG